MEPKDVKGLEEFACIYPDGRLVLKERKVPLGNGRFRTFKKRTAKPRDNGNGYLQYLFEINGTPYRFYQHRLLAEHFLDKPKDSEDLEVNHINHIRNDNRLENLEWVTRSENQMKSAIHRGVRLKKKYCSCSKEIHRKSTRCKDCENERRGIKRSKIGNLDKETLLKLLKENSFEAVAKMNGVSSNAIRKRCKKLGIPHLSSHYRNLRQY